MDGGDLAAAVLQAQGVRFVFTLIGGHISPILVGCRRRGLRVIDVRHEATAVFAADAAARLSGIPGVAIVTAGPGVTNTVTAVKNAQMAGSPVVLLGGAAATALRGRGALQDIDQLWVLRSLVKWSVSVRRLAEIAPRLEEAFRRSQEGMPGPVFVELPVDLLYPEEIVRRWYGVDAEPSQRPKARTRFGRNLVGAITKGYLRWHVGRLFAGKPQAYSGSPTTPQPPAPDPKAVRRVAERLLAAERPLLLVGSQAVLDVAKLTETAAALERAGAPVYLSGMARGLLGRGHPLQLRHRRREALAEADFVLLAGVPLDFRLDYGRHLPRGAFLAAVNRSRGDLRKNRRPAVAAEADAGAFLRQLAAELPDAARWPAWRQRLRERDDGRAAEIEAAAHAPGAGVNPLHLCREIEQAAAGGAILVADGGDFVATASYIVQPRGPLSWLDPGPFGTLGVGAGFALGAKLVRPEAEIWILYGDGSLGYSLAEFDTFVRHGIPVIAVVGNDARWAQIARDQIELLGDDVATVLAYTDYHRAVEGLGGAGLRIADPELVADGLAQARAAAAAGRPVLVNIVLAESDFRKGSLAM